MISKYFTGIISILISSCIYTQQNELINHIDNNGKKQGTWIEEVNKENIKRTVAEYKDGEFHGIYLAYFPNDSLAVSAQFNSGLATGTLKNYFLNGQVQFEIAMENGIKSGSFKEFWNNGNLKTLKYYYGDSLYGDYYEYDIDGDLYMKAIELDNDSTEWFNYYKSGNIEMQGKKKAQVNVGIWKEYSEMGKLTKTIIYKEGRVLTEEEEKD